MPFDSESLSQNTTLNNNNNNNMTCKIFTDNQLHTLQIITVVISILAAIACLIAIIFILMTKSYKQFLHRLTLYLSVVTFLLSMASIFRMLPVKHSNPLQVRPRYEDMCAFIGFLVTYTNWMKVLLTSWITLYLFLLAVFKEQPNKPKHELAGILVFILVPLGFLWMPFTQGMYGLAGAWCWIKITEGSCEVAIVGLMYQIVIYYGPHLLLTALSFTGMLTVATFLCKMAFFSDTHIQDHYRKAVREAMPFLIYTFLADVMNVIGLVGRVYHAAVTVEKNRRPNFPLWIIHATVIPLDGLLIPLVLIFPTLMCRKICERVNNLKKRICHTQTQPYTQCSDTIFIGPKDSCTEVERLVIRNTITAHRPHH